MSFVLDLERSLPLPVSAACVFGGVAFLLFFCLALRLGKKEWYLSAFFFFTACTCFFAYLCSDGGRVACATVGLLFCAAFGLTYPVLLAALEIARRHAERKKQRQAQARLSAFVLPDKDNEYLRDRLRTSLCVKEEGTVRTEEAFQLPYVRRVLTKLKAKDLSPADRVEVDRISSEITAYAYEERLTNGQLRLLNDHFARLLKLSTKYAV